MNDSEKHHDETLEHLPDDKALMPTVDPIAERRWVRKLDLW